jgi:hypothetical protein
VLGIVYTAQVADERGHMLGAWAYMCARATGLGCASCGERCAARGPLFDAPDPPYARINASRRAEAV